MALKMQWHKNSRIVVVLALFICATTACKTRSSAIAVHDGSAAADAGTGAHIDLLCLGDRINSPTGPFHYSYKYSDDSNSIVHEAEISPQKIDITSTDRTGTHSYHGVRTDEVSWNAAVLDLSSLRFTSMTARIDSLNGTSSITSQGSESINGYNTTKYSIDTAKATSGDQKQFETLFGRGSFEKGTVWVPADGCAVKLNLDEAILQANGTLTKGHYDIAMIKKSN